MDSVLAYLRRYLYLAMFGILVLCGLGLPLPEEVTLIASGLFVGWKEADFFYASVVCVAAIIAGDSVIFFLGKYYGPAFLDSRPMKLLFSPRRQRKARKLFQRRGWRAIFFARFFAGLRLGMYAYAGAHGMSWFTFAFLDLLGALISGPTSIWLGKLAAENFADSPELAVQKAQEWAHEFRFWILLTVGVTVLTTISVWLVRRSRRRTRAPANVGTAKTPSVTSPLGTLGREDRSGE